MIKYVEITLYSDNNINVETVVEELQKLGLQHKRVRRLKEGDFEENPPPVPPQNKGKKCCGKDKEDEKPLGVLATAKNLAKATREHISKGMSHISPDEYIRRLIICKDCEWIKEGFQCGQCHCFMGIKAGWDIEGSCKLKKW